MSATPLASNDPEHESFPDDNKLYRIFWAGEVLRPKAGDGTSRIRCWLKEIDEDGHDIPGSQILQVTESVGSIPRLVIGSCWRNHKKARPKWGRKAPQVDLDIVAPEEWLVVRAGDHIHSTEGDRPSKKCWISPSDMALSFTTAAGQKIFGHHARLVTARTVSGQEILIPTYEIFRSFFAGTSDLANALVQERWDTAESRFLLGAAHQDTDQGVHLRLDLALGVPRAAVRYLCWLRFARGARQVANRIYLDLVQQSQTNSTTWLVAQPPITGRVWRIRARTQLLPSRNALLVTEICGAEFPVPVASVDFTVPVEIRPAYTPGPEGPPPPGAAPPQRGTAAVSKPRDARSTKRFAHLPAQPVDFLGLPEPKRTARSQRIVPIEKKGPSTQPPRGPTAVSVGVPGTNAAPPRAQFTAEEEIQIEDRFAAIIELMQAAAENGEIDDWDFYAIVRPMQTEEAVYCEFPAIGLPWTLVGGPEFRQRLALVIEVNLGDRTVYWIETEILPSEPTHSSLAVETTDGGSLEEGMLDALLELCARKRGSWPETLPFGDPGIVATRRRHSKKDDGYSENMLRRAFIELDALKTLQQDCAAATR